MSHKTNQITTPELIISNLNKFMRYGYELI